MNAFVFVFSGPHVSVRHEHHQGHLPRGRQPERLPGSAARALAGELLLGRGAALLRRPRAPHRAAGALEEHPSQDLAQAASDGTRQSCKSNRQHFLKSRP